MLRNILDLNCFKYIIFILKLDTLRWVFRKKKSIVTRADKDITVKAIQALRLQGKNCFVTSSKYKILN